MPHRRDTEDRHHHVTRKGTLGLFGLVIVLISYRVGVTIALFKDYRSLHAAHEGESNTKAVTNDLSEKGNSRRGLRKRLSVRYEEYQLTHGSTPAPPTVDIQPRVVGGNFVKPKDRYPYMAAMFQFPNTYRCGGSLIAPDIVLTAAHCLANVDKVNLGRYDLANSTETYEAFDIVEKLQHPDFRPRLVRHDYALVKLSGSSSYQALRLNDIATIPSKGYNLEVMGWGYTNAAGVGGISNMLKEAQVNYIPNQQCIDNTNYTSFQITNSSICALGPGTDTCTGDSGGPLIVRGIDAKYDLGVGITSFGVSCDDPQYPGVYSRISEQIQWIRASVCNLLSPSYCNYVYNCYDAESFTTLGGRNQSCQWVARRQLLRCPHYGKKFCPASCGLCPSAPPSSPVGQIW